MLATIREFVLAVENLQRISDAHYLFEDECTENLRELIFSFSDADTPEPFRSAMYNLGFTEY